MKLGTIVAALLLLRPALPARAAGAPEIAPAVAKLRAVVDRWRSVPAFRAEIEFKTWMLSSVLYGPSTVRKGGAVKEQGPSDPRSAPDDKVELSARMTFLVAGRKYRFFQEYTDCKAMPEMAEMATEVAYNGKLFQYVKPAASLMEYSKKESVGRLNSFIPFPQLQPLQFLCVGTVESRANMVQWPELFNDKLVRDRLSKGVVGSIKTKSRQRPTVTFGGGKWEGEPVAYRVYVDGPDGQPSQIDYVDGRGTAVADTKFEYAVPGGGGAWSVPMRMTMTCYPSGGKVVFSMTADTKKIEIAPKLAEDEFTIDFTSVNTVIDRDARKTVAGANAGTPRPAKKGG
jgi:hypothetical protein